MLPAIMPPARARRRRYARNRYATEIRVMTASVMLTVTTNGSENPSSSSSGVATSE